MITESLVVEASDCVARDQPFTHRSNITAVDRFISSMKAELCLRR